MFVRIAVLLLVVSAPVGVQVEISFPLEGYYRPGRYVPVKVGAKVDGAEQESVLELTGSGAISTRVRLEGGRAEGIVPMLPLENTLQALTWRVRGRNESMEAKEPGGQTSPPLRPLLADQRLVGVVAPSDIEIGRQLFSEMNVIPIRLDAADPLPGAAAAWELLDAIVLDEISFRRVNGAKVVSLLAGGTIVAVRSVAAPDDRWGWRREGEAWVLRHEPAGPRFAGVYPAGFGPVQGWAAQWPGKFRARLVIYAALFSIVIMGVSLLRGRWMPLAAVAVVAATSVGMAVWWRGHPVLMERTGKVVVINGLAQTDTWTWQSAAGTTIAGMPWWENVRPMFHDDMDARDMEMRLECASDGQPLEFRYTARQGRIVGWVWRSLGMVKMEPEPMKGHTDMPMTALARRVYLRQGDEVVGIVPPDADADSALIERWMGAVVRRSAAGRP